MFEVSANENIYTQHYMRLMEQRINELLYNKDWQARFCHTNTHRCEHIDGVRELFFGFHSSGLYDPDFSNVSGILSYAFDENYASVASRIRLFSPRSVIFDEETRTISANSTAVYFKVGEPILGYDDILDRTDAQDAERTAFMQNTVLPLLTAPLGDMKIHVRNSDMLRARQKLAAESDLDSLWVVFPLILIVVLLKTRSLFLSLSAIIHLSSVLLSAALIHTFVLDHKYFGWLHLLVTLVVGLAYTDNLGGFKTSR